MANKESESNEGNDLLSGIWASVVANRALATLANSPHLTLLVGAGVSINRGIPGWGPLLKELLNRATARAGLTKAQSKLLAASILNESSDYLAIAQLLVGMRGRDWVAREIENVFYKGELERTADDYLTALAFLIVARDLVGLRTTVISTNFDDILEREINQSEDLKNEISLVPVYDDATYSRSTTGRSTQNFVFHVHGIVAKDGIRSPIVFTLDEYASIPQDSWTEAVFTEANEADVWLTIGMSLTDLHVLKHLLSRANRVPDATTYALMARHNRNEHRSDQKIHYALEKSVSDAYKDLGVTPIFADWHSELAIYLDEVFLHTGGSPPDLEPYSQRFEVWRRKVHLKQSHVRKSDKIGLRELYLSKHLQTEAHSLERYLSTLFGTSENLKIEYWELQDAGATLKCIASSDGVKYESSSRPEVELSPTSEWAVALSVLAGQVKVLSQPNSRWQTIYAQAIRLYDAPHFGLQVGAVAISSTASRRDSGLVGDSRVESRLDETTDQVAWHIANSVLARPRKQP